MTIDFELPKNKALLNVVESLFATFNNDELLVRQNLLDQEYEQSIIDAFVEKVNSMRENPGIITWRSIKTKKLDKWYTGPKSHHIYWPDLVNHLKTHPDIRWDEETIDSIDEESNEVVSLLGNPKPGLGEFTVKGLVLGYVQSGKTANMAAVIAKAADAGYNTIIILAGLTNKLRAQTQKRLMRDVVEHRKEKWHVLTSEEKDFIGMHHAGMGFTANFDTHKLLLVIKKNVSPLKKLLTAFTNTIPPIQKQMRILLIDDECDQASLNSARGNLNVSAINMHIRELLDTCKNVSYVGYTATPFANVLINPNPNDPTLLDDLYPSDFIHPLSKPEGYFGSEKLFGNQDADSEPEYDGIRDVTEDEKKRLLPKSRNEAKEFWPELVQSLETAIYYYLACCCVRRIRGQSNKHMTMLVHTSPSINQHERMYERIQQFIKSNKTQLLIEGSTEFKKLIDTWDAEKNVNETPSRYIPTEKEIASALKDVLAHLEIVVENGDSDDRIFYDDHIPKTYIVVGGTILARGLTLEGLTVSYFVRHSTQYDTLLQMGRWFGYRGGYEDLPRIWTTNALSESYEELASIELEIRQVIRQYKLLDMTPADLPVKIRQIKGMQITQKVFMRNVQKVKVSYWGAHKQILHYDHTNENLVENNWSALKELFGTLKEVEIVNKRRVWKKIPRDRILKFARNYSDPKILGSNGLSDQVGFTAESLAGFIESNQDERLDYWNLAIIEASNGKETKRSLPNVKALKTVTRTQANKSNKFANIRSLMSMRDVAADCEVDVSDIHKPDWEDYKIKRKGIVGETPLLLIYIINGDSKVSASSLDKESRSRKDLDAVDDLVAFSVVFPGNASESSSYVETIMPTREASPEEEEENQMEQESIDLTESKDERADQVSEE